MLTVIWVLGSMLLMLLIHFLLPLGYTKKGKFIVVVTSGLFAMGGLTAVSAFPLWQTFLVLFALSFLSAYVMDSRLGKVMYPTKEQFIEDIEYEDSDSSSILTKQTEETLNIELMDLSELEITTPSSSVLKQNEDSILPESLDEDISFLQDREIASNTVIDSVDNDLEVAYLSDIESLLEEEEVDLQDEKLESLDEEGWLDELAELTVLKEDENSPNLETQVDDFELEELFADKEVAVSSDRDGNKPNKVLELQK
jgi:hypothetical protein